MDNVLVSIVIPVYNVEKYLGECLESVLGQSYFNIEVICVADISVDNSIVILKDYARKDSRIKIIENPVRGGLSAARNKGFVQAKGKYIYYLDSDDYIKPNAIENLTCYAEKYEVECIYFDSEILKEAEGLGGPRLRYGLNNIDKKVLDGPTLFKIMKEYDVYTNSVWRRFWKVEFLKDNKLSFADELFFAEDSSFSLAAILCGKRMMVVNESYHVYRRHEGTLSTKITPLKVKYIFKNYCMLLEFWKKHEIPKDIEEILSDHLEKLLITVKREYFRLKNEIRIDDFEEGLEKHLFGVLVVQKYEESLNEIDDIILHKIKGYENVIVYGAGRYAVETVNRLMRKGIKIRYLAITHMHENAVGINNIPLKEIKELLYMKDSAIVVLGVSKSSRKDVIETLQRNGFLQYIELD